MSLKPTPYRTEVFHPTATTTYTISDYTSTVLDDADEYQVEISGGGATLTQKSSTAFQVAVGYDSPQCPVTVQLQFMRVVA